MDSFASALLSLDDFGGGSGGGGRLESESEPSDESLELLSDSDELEDGLTTRILELMYTFFLPVSSHLTIQPSENLWLERKMVPDTPFLDPLIAITRSV